MYQITEQGADTYPSIDDARLMSIEPVAAAIARAIRAGIASGRYAVVDGFVVPAGITIPVSQLDTVPQEGV